MDMNVKWQMIWMNYLSSSQETRFGPASKEASSEYEQSPKPAEMAINIFEAKVP